MSIFRRRRQRGAVKAHVLRRWQEQLPGLEQIARCPDCRVIIHGDGTSERVPCHWHADIRSVAIERQVSS